jgi:hypothetical protein
MRAHSRGDAQKVSPAAQSGQEREAGKVTKERILKEIENRIEQLQKRREKLYGKEITRGELEQAKEEINDEIYALLAMLEAGRR